MSEHFHKLLLEPSAWYSRVVLHRDGSATIMLRNHYRRLATYGWTATTGLERKLSRAPQCGTECCWNCIERVDASVLSR